MKLTKLTMILLACAAIAGAGPLQCGGISDVTTIKAAGCSVTGSSLVFSNFTLSVSAGFSSAVIGIGEAHAGGGDTVLDFQIGGIQGPGSPAFGDIELGYRVKGPLDGIGIWLQSTQMAANSNVTITELVCTKQFINNTCSGKTLANLLAISMGDAVHAASTFKTEDQTLWIKKDIQFNGATISDFANSHTTPEPASIGLSGLGLALILCRLLPNRKNARG